jgi:hypothetical protein
MQAHIAHCVSCLVLIQLTQLSESSRADAQIKLLSLKAPFVKQLACMPVKGAVLFPHTPGWQSQKRKSGLVSRLFTWGMAISKKWKDYDRNSPAHRRRETAGKLQKNW